MEGGFWIEGPSLLDVGERGRYELMGDVPEGEIHWEVEGESLVEPYEYPNPLYYGLTGLYEGNVLLKAMQGEKVLFPFDVEVKDVDSGFLVDAGSGKLALGGKMSLSFSLEGEELPAKELSSVSITTLSSPSGKGLVSSYEDEGLYLLGEELGSFRAVASYEGLLSNPFEIEVIPSVEGKTYRLGVLLEDGTPAEWSTIPTSSTVTFVLRDEEGGVSLPVGRRAPRRGLLGPPGDGGSPCLQDLHLVRGEAPTRSCLPRGSARARGGGPRAIRDARRGHPSSGLPSRGRGWERGRDALRQP